MDISAVLKTHLVSFSLLICFGMLGFHLCSELYPPNSQNGDKIWGCSQVSLTQVFLQELVGTKTELQRWILDFQKQFHKPNFALSAPCVTSNCELWHHKLYWVVVLAVCLSHCHQCVNAALRLRTYCQESVMILDFFRHKKKSGFRRILYKHSVNMKRICC